MGSVQIQIQPRISQELKDRLETECKVRRVTQGAIVEAALAAFFEPGQYQETKLDTILELLRGIQSQLDSVAHLPSPQAPENPSPIPQAMDPMAFYAVLQGGIHNGTQPPATLQPQEGDALVDGPITPRKRGWWSRIFWKGR